MDRKALQQEIHFSTVNELDEIGASVLTNTETTLITSQHIDRVTSLKDHVVCATGRHVKVFHLNSGMVSLKFEYQEPEDITALTSLRGSSFATVNGNGQFIIHNLEGMYSSIRIGGPLTSVAATPEGCSIVGKFDGMLILLDDRGHVIREIGAHDSWVTALESRHGKVVSAAGKGDVIIWDASEMVQLVKLSHNTFVLDVAIGPNNVALACTPDQVNILNNDKNYELTRTLKGLGARKLVFLDSDILICGGANGVLNIILTRNGELATKLRVPVGDITDLAMLGSNTCCVAGLNGSVVIQLPSNGLTKTKTSD